MDDCGLIICYRNFCLVRDYQIYIDNGDDDKT